MRTLIINQNSYSYRYIFNGKPFYLSAKTEDELNKLELWFFTQTPLTMEECYQAYIAQMEITKAA